MTSEGSAFCGKASTASVALVVEGECTLAFSLLADASSALVVTVLEVVTVLNSGSGWIEGVTLADLSCALPSSHWLVSVKAVCSSGASVSLVASLSVVS